MSEATRAGDDEGELWDLHGDRLEEWEKGDNPVLRAIARAARDRRKK